MSRYQACFNRLSARHEGAFVPFVTLGDPDQQTSLAIIDTLVEAGADALELGIPFSDPLADGPVIQNATMRALDAGMTVAHCFEMLTIIRQRHPELPVGLLMYANLVVAHGIEDFYERCQQAGVDSVLVADVPVAMSEPFSEAAHAHGIAPIFIAPPNGDEQTLKEVANAGSGYTYLLSRAGVTGAESEAAMPVADLLATLHRYQAAPPLLGFGISRPEQVQHAIKAGAAGAISGSAVVRIIEQHLDDKPAMLDALAQFVSSMKQATRQEG